MPKAKRLPSGNWRARGYNKTTKTYKSFTDPKKSVAERLAAEYAESAVVVYENLTVGEAYDRYIESKSRILSPSTYREYKKQRNRDFSDLLSIRLKRLTPELIQTAVNELKGSSKTVKNKFTLLKSVLEAYRPDLNLKHIKLYQEEKEEIIIPSQAEVDLLLDNADEKLKMYLLMICLGGLRRSEMCALTPDDFSDFDVYITKAKVKGESGWVIKPPKTKAGKRHVPLPYDFIKKCKDFDFSVLEPNKVTDRFIALKEKCGVDIRFHDLRHYYASVLFNERDINLAYVKEVMGHSSLVTTLNLYTHCLKEKRIENSNKVVSIFKAYDTKYATKPSKHA